MRALRRLGAFAHRNVYVLSLGAVVVGVAVALYSASVLAGGIIAGVGMFVAGVTDPMSGPGGEG